MRKKIFILISVVILFFSTLMLPVIYTYNSFFSDSYHQEHKVLEYEELFFNPKSKKYNIYTIGGFGYIDISILSKHPEEIIHYENEKMFDRETIDKLISILEKCTFIPIESKEAFFINYFKHKSSNDITSLSIDNGWFEDSYHDLFSEKVVEEINEQLFGISECTLFECDGKLYLVGAYTYEIVGGSFIKYEKPNFGKTKTVFFEVAESEASKELIEMREVFYPGEDNVYSLPTINITVLVCILAVYVTSIITIAVVIRRRKAC